MEIMQKKPLVRILAKGYAYDYETTLNAILVVFIDLKNSKSITVFEISRFKNDLPALIDFLERCIKEKTALVSYNGIKFDNQISRYIVDNKRKLLSVSGLTAANQIYKIAQTIIALSRERERPMYMVYNDPFKEIDLLSINNYDNPQKRTSLKWLQYTMDWHNIEDMSMDHTLDASPEDILGLIKYCINDCLSTKLLFFKNKSEILLRGKLSTFFNLHLRNASEPKLAKEIFLKILSEEMNIPKRELREMRTYRNKINLSEAILPYIQYTTPVFQETLKKFKSLTIDGENLKGSFKHEVKYRGMDISFALGGIHGAKRGVFVEGGDYIILSFDVVSYYPNLIIKNKWAPAHLDTEIFCRVFENTFNERKKYPKKDPLNYVYKIVLNSTYGLSNEANSFLKDSLLTMKTTCNGQLLLVMLMEALCERIPGANPIMLNTDGGEVMLPKEHKELFYEICREWEKQTELQLEYEQYHKLCIRDVNNYIGIYSPKEITKEAFQKLKTEFPKPLVKINKDKTKLFHYGVKCKGAFEIDKALHKNKSYRIKAIACYNHFVHGKSITETLAESRNILDYCAGHRAKGNAKFLLTCLNNGVVTTHDTQKTIRYFMSSRGCKITKIMNDKSQKLEANKAYETLLNVYDETIPFEEYPLDIPHYSQLIRNEISTIDPNYLQNKLIFQ